MLFTAAQKTALQTIVSVWVALAAGASAIALSHHPDLAPPPLSPHATPPPAYSGSRIALSTYLDVPPPEGCGALTYAANEADLRLHLGVVPDYNSTAWRYPVDDARAVGSPAPTAAFADFSGAPQHSSTNNQVAGVDELDSTQTDGWYIYTTTGATIVIVRAYPADSMQVVSTIELGGYPYGIFVNGDRLVVILQPSYPYYGQRGAPTMFAGPIGYYNPGEVEIRVFDLADRAYPQILYNYSVTGTFTGARMVGDFVYLVAGYWIYTMAGDLKLPTVTVNSVAREMDASSIGLPAGSMNTTLLAAIVSVNVTGSGDAKSFAYLSPAYGQIYMSEHNIYLLGAFYDYTPDWSFVSTETAIAKFSFYKGDVLCYFGARVPGTILNQFSADESPAGGHPYLRVATTVRGSAWTNVSTSVFVLSEKLERVGSIEGIAPGETIQASRFVGDRGYVVTFRRVDPLFVLDLKDPARPSIAAELTLPGFSSYLQPIDEGHLLGIGVDATDAGGTTGLKLSLFDVTDGAHPRETANYSFGAYSYSEAQYDHKAVLYIAARGLLVIPVQVYDYTADFRSAGNSFQGAYVFAVDLTTGFTLKAKIAHDAVPSAKDPYTGTVYTYAPSVRRSLFIGEYLYTVSEAEVMANELDGFAAVSGVTIATLYSGPYYGGGVTPSSGGASAGAGFG